MEIPPGGKSGGASKKDWRKPENKRGSARRGGRRRRKPAPEGTGAAPREASSDASQPEPQGPSGNGVSVELTDSPSRNGNASPGSDAQAQQDGPRRGRRRRRGRRGSQGQAGGVAAPQQGGRSERFERPERSERPERGDRVDRQGGARRESREASGMLVIDKGGFGSLRSDANDFLPSKDDVWVSKQLILRLKLREGSILAGPVGRGQGKHKWALNSVETVDGRDPKEVMNLTPFKKLTSIDPDFHYAVGDATGEISLKILDLICPIGRGSRGLLVAPPRSGKTILMRQFAKAVEELYPDVHLMVLLVDERPEEATEWRRSTKGRVFVSTNDEMAKRHVQLAEAVWKRCCRLVELGEEVILLLDSITRLARAYNSLDGGSGRTMSGGLDSRTMERPKGLFGSARNTETAGSLTILGTTLVETGSRMDQVIFEEFKGTGNMELVLSRRLADRRVFPAIDLERSGTRKEEKLLSPRRLRQITTLRRVLMKMNFAEAMELLITKVDEVEKTDDFLQRFEVDPEA